MCVNGVNEDRRDSLLTFKCSLVFGQCTSQRKCIDILLRRTIQITAYDNCHINVIPIALNRIVNVFNVFYCAYHLHETYAAGFDL